MLLANWLEEWEETVEYGLTCIVCKGKSTHVITPEQYKRWCVDGEYIQNVFPDKTPAEREFLMTGTHPNCWDQLMDGIEA